MPNPSPSPSANPIFCFVVPSPTDPNPALPFRTPFMRLYFYEVML